MIDGIHGTDGCHRSFTTDFCRMREKDDSAVAALAMAARCGYEEALAAIFPDNAPAGTKIIRCTWKCTQHHVRFGACNLFLMPARTLRATTAWDMVRGHSIVRVELMGDVHAWHWVWIDRGRFVYDPRLEVSVHVSRYKLYPIAAVRLMVL